MEKKQSYPLEVIQPQEDNRPMPDYMALTETFLNKIIDFPDNYRSNSKTYNFMEFYNELKAISDLCVATQAYQMFALRRAEHIKSLETIHLLDVPVMDRPMATLIILIDSLQDISLPIEQATIITFWMPIAKYFADKAKIFYDQASKETVVRDEDNK